MSFTPPAPAVSADPAAWLPSRIEWGDDWVTGTVGTGYQAYARIFHPLDDGPNPPRWADVAAQHGRTMHPSAQWEHISSTVAPTDTMSRGRGFPGEPDIGNLHAEALSSLCTLLRDYTTTPDDCWFAVWDGWGWQHPGAHSVMQATRIGEPAPPVEHASDEKRLNLAAPKFSLPHRDYYLFTGPIDAATRIGDWITATWFDPQSPSIFWPTDLAWCVATEIDFDTTVVGGTRDLIAAISSSTQLEALPIAPDAPYQDLINT
jgi:hypothetical protein